jgi:hypothetical protein
VGRKYIVIKTKPKKEHIVARDLCDCLYYYDENVKCEVITTGTLYVYTYLMYFEKCLSYKYFKALIRSIYYFDDVAYENPTCEKCHVTKIGKFFFIRRG